MGGTEMTIDTTVAGTELNIVLEGRLDTNTAPELEAELKKRVEGITSLVIDIEKLEYISSAGLRVLLSAHKIMVKQGTMVIKNVRDEVREIFEVTGFDEILNIE